MPTARSALSANDFAGEGRHLGIVGIFRHVDEALMSAGIAEAGGDEMMHAEMAHVAQRHRRTLRVLGLIRSLCRPAAQERTAT